MKLHVDNSVLEIECSTFGDMNTPGEDDLLLNITVQVKDYSAADQGWVVASDWEGFLAALQTLERDRRGKAVLEGASPEEFYLEFFSTDSAGHMAVKGHVGRNAIGGHLLQLKFGFTFEPDRLPYVLQEFRSFPNHD